jgi:hypothetical protein
MSLSYKSVARPNIKMQTLIYLGVILLIGTAAYLIKDGKNKRS